jgi:K+-transporting ATPase A subunit
MLVLTLLTVMAGYAVLRLQDRLPLNPGGVPAMPADLSLNTAISFATNTSWQNYAGEQALTYLSQMLVITALSFSSAATGIALAIAFIRGLARRRARRAPRQRPRPRHGAHHGCESLRVRSGGRPWARSSFAYVAALTRL